MNPTSTQAADFAAYLTPYLRIVVRENPQATLRQATGLAIRLAVETHERNTARMLEPLGWTGRGSNAAQTAAANRDRVSATFGGTYDEFRSEAAA